MQVENKPPGVTPAPDALKGNPAQGEPGRERWRSYMLAVAALVACFGISLYRLVMFAARDELYSYILLMPFVSWYLIRMNKPAQTPDSKPLPGIGLGLLLAGAAVMGGHILFARADVKLEVVDHLTISILAFYMCLLGVSCIFLGRETLRRMSFPLGILAFMVPMPVVMREGITVFLENGSAMVADWLFQLAGTPYFRNDLTFYLPRIQGLYVAPECSGIHSSWILLVTSLLGGYLFLRSP